jgi:hypothetical protein
VNILTDVLPESLSINHTEYPIDPDFRTCLQIILAFEDAELTPQEKQGILLSMLFVDMPPITQETFEQAQWFLNGGMSDENEDAPMRLYSFAKDANFIFAAFKSTHNVDLQKADLHWHEFLALFMDMGSETTFCQLTAMRKRLKTGKASKEEKQFAHDHPDMINVPEIDDRNLEEKELAMEFERKVEEARRKQNANG